MDVPAVEQDVEAHDPGPLDPAAVLARLGHAVIVVGLDGGVRWANPAAERLTWGRRPAHDNAWSPFAQWQAVRDDGSPLPPDQRPVAIAMRTGQAVHNRIVGFRVPESGATHWMLTTAVPWRDAEDRIVGAVASFDDITAARAAVLDDRARLAAGRPHGSAGEVLRAVERALVPRPVPEIAGATVASRTLPAVDRAALGGDWCDVLDASDDRALLCVGDATGHGLEALAVMHGLRIGLRVLARLGPERLGALLQGLHRVLTAEHPGELATVVLARYRPSTGAVECVTAGHLPPVVRRGDGRVEWLGPAATGPALGIRTERREPPFATVLAPGDALVLFSDGLIERRGESLDVGYARLSAYLEQPMQGASEIADAALRQLPATGHGDDVCVLVLERTAP